MTVTPGQAPLAEYRCLTCVGHYFRFLPAVKISGIDMKTVKGRDLIIVEDIIDTGTTMSKLIPALEEYGPKSVKVAGGLRQCTSRNESLVAAMMAWAPERVREAMASTCTLHEMLGDACLIFPVAVTAPRAFIHAWCTNAHSAVLRRHPRRSPA